MTSISAADFAKLKNQAQLTLTSDEEQLIHAQLDEALQAVAVFDELDLSSVPPLAHPSGVNNVMREDVITPSFSQAEALKNAPATHNGYVMVPGVFAEQDS